MPKWIFPLVFVLPHLAISVRLPKRFEREFVGKSSGRAAQV
ncbi:hypothetical protein RchiOBHm_Chr2g0125731 [Rosa chinensis]|uniref:Uncharacterized protein n=1 Tax=Rosa chinensis TaxID=74649 RepID=A0A2P6RTP5_ROSCH|nr:hypothetical protein RchiOBHm_Chr2g0125731 [Rosa chinensis]